MQTSRRDFLKTAGTASALLAAGGGFLAAGPRQNKMVGDQESMIISGMLGQNPKYKILWTWDYCVYWDDTFFWRGRGASGENQRRSHFLKDYKRMVDFSSEHGINGIVIWGALRAHDDGVEQFRELVNYGKQKGVRILPGVGVFAYGGIFYDPRTSIWTNHDNFPTNPYSLASWLKEHPELRAVGPDGTPHAWSLYGSLACMSKRENLEWFKRSFEWLCEEFKIEGAQVEVGDYGICHCDECKKKRTGGEHSGFMLEDMAEPYTIACEIAKKSNPDPWIICETYSSFAKSLKPETEGVGHFYAAMSDTQKKFLADALPDYAIVQWAMDKAVPMVQRFEPSQDWTDNVYLPSKNNISRIHHGSQWAFNGRDEWAVYAIGEMVRKSRASGVNGVSIFGEESPMSPPNEANYLVFSEFSGLGNKNPNCDFNAFYAKTLDPLYGGSGMSLEWRRIYVTGHFIRQDLKTWQLENTWPHWHYTYYEIGRPDLFDEVLNMSADEKRSALIRLASEACGISSKLSGEACRRWAWLVNWLGREEFLFRNPH